MSVHVALYSRVSTDEQATQGFSLDAQKERLEAFCKSQGWTDFQHYVDDGYTGTNMDRPALQRLIRHIKQRRISTVVVFKLDRLGRRQRHVLYLLEEVFEPHGVSFKSVTEPFDTSTPLGRAMLGILAVFSQLERDTIIERTRAGMKQRVRQGLWMGAPYPYGYIMGDDGVLKIVPHEAEVVREAYKKFLAGENRASIQRWLEPRVSNRSINTLFVRRLFTRQTYTGRIVLNGEVFEGKHEPIIDMETFERVQKKLKSIVIPRGGQRHLLSGLLTCGVCGSGMHYWEARQRHYRVEYRYMRLVCQTKRSKSTHCASKRVLAREIQEKVIQTILSTNIDIELTDVSNDVSESLQVLSDHLEDELRQVNTQIERLLDAVQSGAIPSNAVKPRFEALEANKQALLVQLDDIAMQKPEIDLIALQDTLRKTQDVWYDMTPEGQHAMLRALVKRVIVYPDKQVQIEWNL